MTDNELRAEFQSLRAGWRTEFQGLREHVDARLTAQTAETDARFAEVLQALDALRRALGP